MKFTLALLALTPVLLVQEDPTNKEALPLYQEMEAAISEATTIEFSSKRKTVMTRGDHSETTTTEQTGIYQEGNRYHRESSITTDYPRKKTSTFTIISDGKNTQVSSTRDIGEKPIPPYQYPTQKTEYETFRDHMAKHTLIPQPAMRRPKKVKGNKVVPVPPPPVPPTAGTADPASFKVVNQEGEEFSGATLITYKVNVTISEGKSYTATCGLYIDRKSKLPQRWKVTAAYDETEMALQVDYPTLKLNGKVDPIKFKIPGKK